MNDARKRRKSNGEYDMNTKLKPLGLAAVVSLFAMPALAAEEVKIGAAVMDRRASHWPCAGRDRDLAHWRSG